MKKVYIIGSLRNQEIPVVAKQVRDLGFNVFDDWIAAGPEADDYWKKYELQRGRTYAEALEGLAARHNFFFDKDHLDSSDIGVLVLPAGKSGHLELGYLRGREKPVAILLDDKQDRFDLMYKFAKVCHNIEELLEWLKGLD